MRKYLLTILLCFLFIPSIVFADSTSLILESKNTNTVVNVLDSSIDYDNLCSSSASVRKTVYILGNVIYVLKLVVPFIIIVLGMIDFTKAIISDDQNALRKATIGLMRRVGAGIAIFFIPTLLMLFLRATGVAGDVASTSNTAFGACTTCLLDTSKCDINESTTHKSKSGEVHGGGSRKI